MLSTELNPNENKALKSYNDYIVLYETYIQHNLPLPFSGFISLVRMGRRATFIGDTQSELIYIKKRKPRLVGIKNFLIMLESKKLSKLESFIENYQTMIPLFRDNVRYDLFTHILSMEHIKNKSTS